MGNNACDIFKADLVGMFYYALSGIIFSSDVWKDENIKKDI